MNYFLLFFIVIHNLFDAPLLFAEDLSYEVETHLLKTQLIPLKTVQVGKGFDDLELLKPILQDVRVLALGEATHGTSEFFQFKHRMLEFFVREMGCRFFAIEASYIECQPINEYILYGKGELSGVVPGQGFWCWDTNEVAEMVEWMRIYNQTASADEKIQFFGFDCQYNSRAGDQVCDLIKKGYPIFYEEANSLLSIFNTPLAIFNADDSQLLQMKFCIKVVSDHLSSHANEWKVSTEEFEKALFLLRLLNQDCEVITTAKNPFTRIKSFIELQHPELNQVLRDEGVEIFFTDEMMLKYPELVNIIETIFEDQSLRDFYMAENILYFLNQMPMNARLFVWAHNGHVAFDKYDGLFPMGSYLKENLKSTYYAFGFVTSLGTFRALGRDKPDEQYELKVFSLPLSLEDSWAGFCSQLGKDRFILDFHTASVSQWLNTPHFLLSIGSVFSSKWLPEVYFSKLVPIKYFDGLIYLHETHAAHPY